MTADPMTHPSPEAVERALTYFAGKPKSFTGMLATLHGKTLAAHVAALTAKLEAERKRADKAEDERDEYRQAPWPDWANKMMDMLREAQAIDRYDEEEGVDLAEMFREWIDNLSSEVEKQKARAVAIEHSLPLDEVRARLRKAVQAAGSLRKWCQAQGVASGHASEFLNATRGPGSDILTALGLCWRIVESGAEDLTTRLSAETARADKAEKFIRTISESPFAPFRVQNACAAYLLDASEKRVTKTEGDA